MTKAVSISLILLTAVFLLPSQAAKNNYSAQACNSWFRAVDRNGDGSLGKNERADEFLGRVTLGSETDGGDGTFIMSRAFFTRECMIGSLGKPQS
jgi:hypothetical protein